MPKLNVLNINGQNVGEIELVDSIFNVEVNEHVLYEVVKNQLANKRQGTQSAKTRAEVRGGGRKPWKQKGTGRARQGSIRATQWRGGGIAGGVTPRDYTFKMNKKERVLALKSALTYKAKEKELVIIDSLNIKSLKTKDIKDMIKTMNLEGKILFVTASDAENLYMAVRNLGYALVIMTDEINCYDLINADTVVVESAAVKMIEEALK